MNAKRVAIKETHEIPSRGLVYDPSLKIPAEITLRAMTTVDEKIRLSSSGITTMPNLVQSCIVEPEKIDVTQLKLFDLHFLMYKLRTITYGPIYKLQTFCPECGKRLDFNVNLDEIPVNPVKDDFKEPFEIGPLPISKDVMSCQILSIADFISMEKEGKRLLNKFPDYVGDPEFLLGYAFKILKINSQELMPFQKAKYIEEMHARDMRFFDSKYDSFVNGIGMDLTKTDICTGCGKDINFTLSVTEEFFRPTYSDE